MSFPEIHIGRRPPLLGPRPISAPYNLPSRHPSRLRILCMFISPLGRSASSFLNPCRPNSLTPQSLSEMCHIFKLSQKSVARDHVTPAQRSLLFLHVYP